MPGTLSRSRQRWSDAAAAPAWSIRARRWRPIRPGATEGRPTGRGRCRGLATCEPGSCWWAWRPPPTAQTGPGQCSPAIARASGSTPLFTEPDWRAGRSQRAATTGSRLHDAYVTAVNRCAPPSNRPTPARARQLPPVSGRRAPRARAGGGHRCPGLLRMGGRAPRDAGAGLRDPAPEATVRARRRAAGGPADADRVLPPLAAEHLPGKLTEPMLDAVLARAREAVEGRRSPSERRDPRPQRRY